MALNINASSSASLAGTTQANRAQTAATEKAEFWEAYNAALSDGTITEAEKQQLKKEFSDWAALDPAAAQNTANSMYTQLKSQVLGDTNAPQDKLDACNFWNEVRLVCTLSRQSSSLGNAAQNVVDNMK